LPEGLLRQALLFGRRQHPLQIQAKIYLRGTQLNDGIPVAQFNRQAVDLSEALSGLLTI